MPPDSIRRTDNADVAFGPFLSFFNVESEIVLFVPASFSVTARVGQEVEAAGNWDRLSVWRP